jgi:CelD/BcsL family acetyltransferase involved in cellulose biosynthesis
VTTAFVQRRRDSGASGGCTLNGELVTDVEAADALDGWDDLADAAGRPYSRRGWMLPWWAAAAPRVRELAVAVAKDHGRPVAIAPCYVERYGPLRILSLLSSRVSSPIEPLVETGREQEAAPILAQLLATKRPDAVRFSGLPLNSPWPVLLQRSWPRPTVRRAVRWNRLPTPRLLIAGKSHEEWWRGKSASFRRDINKNRRRLERAGAVLRRVDDAAAIEDGVRAFARLQRARLVSKGWPTLDRHVDEALKTAARRLAPEGRMWLWTAATDDELISVQICVRAGSAMSCWSTSFDEAWAACQPGIQTLHAAIEDAFHRGFALVDLGTGGDDYKYRFATDERWVEDVAIAVRGARLPITLLHLARGPLRDWVVRARLWRRRVWGAP